MRLLVADDQNHADPLGNGLRQLGLAVDICYDGDAALERVHVHTYDVVILDRHLPTVPGDDICRAIAAGDGSTRVLLLSAAATIRDRVDGLALGADDYLTKPFAFAELVARVHALARRARPATPPVLDRAGIVLEPAKRFASRDSRPLSLSPKEFAILEILLRADGAPVGAETLLEKAWDEHADPFTNAVRMAVMTLRRKLGPPPLIHTIPGAGYRLA